MLHTNSLSLYFLCCLLQDCDYPEDLTVPETRPEAGVDHVDVMGFLGLKRAAPVGKKKEESEEDKLSP